MVATGAAFSLVAASVLLGASAANAANTWVDGANLPAETNPYDPVWFVGGGSTGTLTSLSSGLDMTGKVQILNGDTDTTDLQALVDSAAFDVVSGNAFFQIPVFTGAGGTAYTTLRPAVANSVAATPTDMWRTSSAFGGFAAGATDSLQNFIAGMNPAYEVLAFGAFVDTAGAAVLGSITWDGNTHFFMPEPQVGTISPSSVTVSGLASTGVTFTMSGFTGTEVLLCSVSPVGGGMDLVSEVEVDVESDGTASFVFVGTAPAGEYAITCSDSNPDAERYVSGNFTVTANTVVTDPELAATGGPDATPFVLGGGLLLLFGAGATVFAIRRKHALRG